MKGGKEEEKIMGPLFPRLHVNDPDKGGPRAPPRNKMALYEQLSIPSQRFSSAPVPAPSRPLPPQNGGLQVTSTSLSQGYGHERNGFPSFYMPPHTPAHSAEKVHSRSSGGINNNVSRLQSESRSTRPANERFFGATGSAAEHSSLHQQQSPYGKKSSGNGIDDDDDFRVPTFVQPGNATCSNKDAPFLDTEKGASICSKGQPKSFSTSNCSVQISKSYVKLMEQSKLSSISEKEKNEDFVINEPNERAVGHIVARESLAGLSHSPKSSSDHSKALNVIESSRHDTAVRGQETCGTSSASAGSKCLNEEVLRAKNESCLRASVDANSQILKVAEKQNREINGKPNGPPEMGDAEGNDDASDSSMVDSMSGMEISPDDVVGIIGPKHFWKARRAIINQQRVFAIQVFELHRLIKVQKLIAASPHILLEGSSYLNKSSQKIVPTKTLQHEPVSKPLLTSTQPKDLQRLNQRMECSTEKMVDAHPLPSPEDASHGGHTVQNPRTGPYVGNPMPIPVALDHQKPNPWCYHPPANQWLVPVMSPSEGLCYKPYTGPCPPGGFIPPVYGGCCPMSLPSGDFMNPAYGIPASHQQQNMGVLSSNHPIGPNYFPAPYPVHVMNPMMSPSAVEQISPLAGSRPLGQTEQSSCNISNLRRETISGRICKAQGQVSKESGVQGSTASSPCEKTQADGRDALPLFPTAPQAESLARQPSATCGRENQTRVIKVVPHNARSATESAARIFRSIQEERQQHDS